MRVAIHGNVVRIHGRSLFDSNIYYTLMDNATVEEKDNKLIVTGNVIGQDFSEHKIFVTEDSNLGDFNNFKLGYKNIIDFFKGKKTMYVQYWYYTKERTKKKITLSKYTLIDERDEYDKELDKMEENGVDITSFYKKMNDAIKSITYVKQSEQKT